MSTIAELENPALYREQRESKKYSNTCQYFGCTIAPYNHPTAIAKYILNTIEHTKSYGVQVVAPMGSGKTTVATVLAHHIHVLRPEFKIVWGDSEDFKTLAQFLDKQEKHVPSIFIFDDISGALKEMSDKDMERNFTTLTKIRWIMNPETGETPIITLTTSHYSRSNEKQYRAVLGMTALCNFGTEEATNIDLLAAKNTFARLELTRFQHTAEHMFSKHEFTLKINGKKSAPFTTDKPLRPFVCLMGTNGYTVVYSKEDVCELCSKRKTAKFVPPKKVIEIIFDAYGKVGVQALKLCMYRRGKYQALGKALSPAVDFVETKVLPTLTTDFDQLVNEIYIHAKKKPPTRAYHPRKLEDATLKRLQAEAITVETEDPLRTPDEPLENDKDNEE